ncbi:hypothetical protein [Streptomyces qinzhouensis]|uniref:Secreted protein n=1 Tax=Streptomyces qinzhouensis TaxID=2599401 RepID=A0A5B8J7Y2_9ACTN|nr:hypothetical protein [Streptomyces qinzhouensis]QDY77467.1 hypothetical protein FQU76_14085 [Streptomyces qinzhouensis]
MRTSRTTTVALACAALAALTAGTATASTPVANTCGGAVSDYSGLLGLDTPFTGNATGAGVDRPMTITPQALNGTLVKTEIASGTGDSRYALGQFLLRVDITGRGEIVFPAYAGEGWSENIVCATGTRVTKITGMVYVADLKEPIGFVVSRD